jgi:hypothetical protein
METGMERKVIALSVALMAGLSVGALADEKASGAQPYAAWNSAYTPHYGGMEHPLTEHLPGEAPAAKSVSFASYLSKILGGANPETAFRSSQQQPQTRGWQLELGAPMVEKGLMPGQVQKDLPVGLSFRLSF